MIFAQIWLASGQHSFDGFLTIYHTYSLMSPSKPVEYLLSGDYQSVLTMQNTTVYIV